MQLTAKNSAEGRADDLVVRESFVGTTAFAVGLALVGLLWCAAPLVTPRAWLLSVLFGLPCLGVSAVLFSGLARSRRGPRWVLRADPSGLTLALRSAWNADLADEGQSAVRLERGEIEYLREGTRVDEVPDGEGGRTPTRTRWLEVRLTHANTGELARVLARERERPGVGRTQHHVYPVELPRGDTLRVPWQRLRPSLSSCLRVLARHFEVLPTLDEGRLDTLLLEGEALDAAARELAEGGRMLDALRLLRARRGWSLVECRAFLNEPRQPAA